MIIITGGAGFIGSALLWQLNKSGQDEIIVVDNLASSAKWRNLVNRSYVDYIHKDKFMEIAKNKLPWKIEVVIHLGACSSTTEKNADFLMENNFHYSRDLCRIALENGARFINASSAATYGAGEQGFIDDAATAAQLRPLNMYGYSKQLFDLWLIREHLLQDVTSLKFFNVYGPNEYHKGSMQSVIVKFFDEIMGTGKASLFASTRKDLKNGEQKRDFVYVKDCVKLINWLMDEGKYVRGIRNVGTGKATSYNELAKSLFDALGRPAAINYIDMPEGLAKNYQNYTCARMAWLDQEKYPHKFLDIQSGIKDYVGNYLAKDKSYL